MEQLRSWLNVPVSPVGMGVFRICFGLIMLWDIIRFYQIDLVSNYFGGPVIFPYDFIHLPRLGEGIMHLLLAGLTLSVFLIATGVLYRYAMGYFAVVFTYMFLQDQVLYNNHLYLICLLSFMMIFVRADAALSLNRKKKASGIPRWNYSILQFQLVIVYFFGGIAKLNSFWFDLHPVQELLEIKSEKSGFDFLAAPFMQYFIAYFGIVFDIFIGFLLWMKKSRKIALVLAVAFNLTNAWLFDDIYIFPFFMLAALVLFMEPDTLGRFFPQKGILSVPSVKNDKPGGIRLKKSGLYVLGLYFLIQLILPVRHYFIPGYTDWTGEGQKFAWRMKIQHRKINEVKFALFDLDQKVIHNVNADDFLYPDEISHMCYSPRMIVQFAEFLSMNSRKELGIRRSWVKCKINVSFNGLPPIDIFDPNQDLLEGFRQHDSFNEWINPLPEH